jgi:hypothetical protein
MPSRSFFSIKTTIKKLELYNEWLAVIDRDTSDPDAAENSGLAGGSFTGKFSIGGRPYYLSGAANLGFAVDFFNGNFRLAGEIFYNGEGDAYWYRPRTTVQESEISPFIEGLNGALNMSIRLLEKGNFRFFIQALSAPWQNSTQLTPGFRLTPAPNLELYLAAPMALGSRDGYYYTNTVNVDNKGRPLPFSVMFAIRMNGSVQFGHYY